MHAHYIASLDFHNGPAGGCMGLHEKGCAAGKFSEDRFINNNIAQRGYVLSIDIKPTRKVRGFEQDGASGK